MSWVSLMFSKEKEATFYQVTDLLLSALFDESLRICAVGSGFGGQRLVGFVETESQRVIQAPPGCLSHSESNNPVGLWDGLLGSL